MKRLILISVIFVMLISGAFAETRTFSGVEIV